MTTYIILSFNNSCAIYGYLYWLICISLVIFIKRNYTITTIVLIMCSIISGSIPTEHSFAAQLEAIYKYGTCLYFVTISISAWFNIDLTSNCSLRLSSTQWSTKTCQLFSAITLVFFSIFIIFVPFETRTNTLQRCYKVFNFTLTVSSCYLVKLKTKQWTASCGVFCPTGCL